MSCFFKSAVVILAGGKARRLGGCDKGLLILKDKPLIEYLLPHILPKFDEVFINANRNLVEYKQYGLPVIHDKIADFQGPLAGIAAAMSQVSATHLFVLPCDAPLINAALINRFAESYATYSDKDCILVAFDGERKHYLHALIPLSLASSLKVFLAQGGRGVGQWYAQHKVTIVDFSDMPEIFYNINTPQELDSASSGFISE